MAVGWSLTQFVPNSTLCPLIDILRQRTGIYRPHLIWHASEVAFKEKPTGPRGLHEQADKFISQLQKELYDHAEDEEWVPEWVEKIGQ